MQVRAATSKYVLFMLHYPSIPRIYDRKEIKTMNIQINKNNKTATQNKRQLKTKETITNDIIKILADNNLSIMDLREIIHTASKAICKQKIRTSYSFNLLPISL